MQNIYNANPVKVIVGMVGLPARGKSYISKKIYCFLNWLGFVTQVFNVGNYRRKFMLDRKIELSEDFFQMENKECAEMRQRVAQCCLDDLISFINESKNRVAIFDATNTTALRREHVAQELRDRVKHKYQLIWIESICDDESVITKNIQKSKVNGLDYKNKTSEEVLDSFQRRIASYQKRYEPLTIEEGFSFVKTFNVGQRFELNKITGYLPQKIMTYTINLTISPERNIYLSRHGESEYNTENRVGGNSNLSPLGEKYARALPSVLDELIKSEKERQNLTILTSTLKRTISTAKFIKINGKEPIELKILDEINAGLCENMTYKQILQKHPEIGKERETEKLNFRYPSGESYADVIGRLEPLIYWIERQNSSVMVIGHQAIIRCISAYFFNIDLKELPYISIPLHVIMKHTPNTYTFTEQYVSVDLETGKIIQITKAQHKKFSIDYDGSQNQENPKVKKFRSVVSMTIPRKNN